LEFFLDLLVMGSKSATVDCDAALPLPSSSFGVKGSNSVPPGVDLDAAQALPCRTNVPQRVTEIAVVTTSFIQSLHLVAHIHFYNMQKGLAYLTESAPSVNRFQLVGCQVRPALCVRCIPNFPRVIKNR
jgi:hypothetical protein